MFIDLCLASVQILAAFLHALECCNAQKTLNSTFFIVFFKVHVNLLLIEARMQAELLYALRAITRYMT